MRGVELGHFFPSKMLGWCLFCVICNSNTFHTFIFKLCIMIIDCSHIEDVHPSFCAHLINIFSFLVGVELRHVFHPKSIGGA